MPVSGIASYKFNDGYAVRRKYRYISLLADAGGGHNDSKQSLALVFRCYAGGARCQVRQDGRGAHSGTSTVDRGRYMSPHFGRWSALGPQHVPVLHCAKTATTTTWESANPVLSVLLYFHLCFVGFRQKPFFSSTTSRTGSSRARPSKFAQHVICLRAVRPASC